MVRKGDSLARAKIQSPGCTHTYTHREFHAALGERVEVVAAVRAVAGVLKVGGTRLTVGCWKAGV